MISRYERQNDDSFSFLKQQLDRIESRPQCSLCIQFLNHPRGWFQIGCIKIWSVNWIWNPEGKRIWINGDGFKSVVSKSSPSIGFEIGRETLYLNPSRRQSSRLILCNRKRFRCLSPAKQVLPIIPIVVGSVSNLYKNQSHHWMFCTITHRCCTITHH